MKGCLKYALYAFFGLAALGVILNIVSPEEDGIDSIESNGTSISKLDAETSQFYDSLRIIEQQERDSVLQTLSTDPRFRESSDEFKPDYAFYHPKDAPNYVNINWVYPYIGRKGDQVWLRIKFQYKADDWLFIEKVTALAEKSNGDKKVIELYQGRFERDNDVNIWEYADVSVDDVLYLKLIELSEAKSVKIRYSGNQYYKDRTLTAKERKAMRDILDVYKEIRRY